MNEISVTPLAGSLGAQVNGIDLRNPIDDATMSQLKAWFLEYCVLVYPKQDITPEQQAAFAARWGELHYMPTVEARLEGHPAVIEIDYYGDIVPTTDVWHSDMTMEERPPMASLLLAKLLPPAGGDTIFANQYLAYDRLSAGLKAVLDGLKAVHDGELFGPLVDMDPADLPSNVHPVVRTHPETGRKSLYVNATFTRHFENMTVEESAPLLNWLYAHCSQPNFTFRHRWSEGDLLMWDNRCTQHFAIADYGTARRTMNRATVLGERPY
ncbi:TauD/TfdA dioxygenase family protein [Sphingomonas sp. IC081]|uniref:TauD/TfdA dioxygenase family protein n=1 Tax=Sphingomonas sp. IC081 TaxID=304378 RepID=UPI00163B902D|nr:TauD/TfdA family dioxygenase [Sphingomonas sp. IC081]